MATAASRISYPLLGGDWSLRHLLDRFSDIVLTEPSVDMTLMKH